MATTDYEEVFKEQFLIIAHSKTDSELNDIIKTNCELVRKMPARPSSTEYVDMQKLMGEAKACQEELKSRESRKLYNEKRRAEWRINREEEIKKAVLRIKVGDRPCSHLILSILEEEGRLTFGPMSRKRSN